MSPSGKLVDLFTRPEPANGALRGPTYCDGENAWQPGCGFCGACGGLIERRPDGQPRSNWFCRNKACARWWRSNHQWRQGTRDALRRDRRCVRCHRGDALLQLRARRLRDGRKVAVRLEVNHKNALADSVVGSGAYETSCAHHLDGLETLCTRCHAEETAQQLHERAERRRAQERDQRAQIGANA